MSFNNFFYFALYVVITFLFDLLEISLYFFHIFFYEIISILYSWLQRLQVNPIQLGSVLFCFVFPVSPLNIRFFSNLNGLRLSSFYIFFIVIVLLVYLLLLYIFFILFKLLNDPMNII